MSGFEKNIKRQEEEDSALDLTHEDEEGIDEDFDPEETIIPLGEHKGGNRVLAKDQRHPSLILARRKFHHFLNFGSSGFGKTETYFRIAYLIAKYTDWPMVYLDAKGTTRGAERWTWLMNKAGRRTYVFPNEHFNGFKGSADEVFNCLMEVIPFVMKGEAARYYTDKAIVMLRNICEEYDEPPRSSEELFKRLSAGMMNPDVQKQIEFEGVKLDDMAEIKMRFVAYFRSAKNLMDGKIYWSEIDTGYFIFNSLGESEEAKALAAFTFKSLSQYLTMVKPQDQPFMVFIDEAAAIVGTTSIALLAEQLREFEVALFIALQTLDGFPEDEQGRILGNAATVFIHKTHEPERLANLVVQALEMQMTLRHDADDPGELNLQYQLQKVPGLDVDAVKRLLVGESWVVENADRELLKTARAPRGKLILPTIEPVRFLGPRAPDRGDFLVDPSESTEVLDDIFQQAREEPLPDWSSDRLSE